MRSALDVVSVLLREDPIPGITPLKLQKLLYYTQAWGLVFTEGTLFSEGIEAWVHGPVVRSVYYRYKDYGSQSIYWTDSNPTPELTHREREIVRLVKRTYGSMGAKKLEELTHSEDPWVNARSGLSSFQRSNSKISLQDMKEYYSRFVAARTPPQIKPIALLKTKQEDVTTRSKLSAYLSGAGTNLSFFPPDQPMEFFIPEDFSSDRNRESIASIWEKVGAWMQTSYDLVNEAEDKENE